MTHIISGNKSINLAHVNSDTLDDVDLWQWLYSAPQSTIEKLFAQVAAAYRAARLTAEAVASLPFALVRGETDFDVSDEWQNKVGFLNNPNDLFERMELSLIFNNAAYGRMGKNILGYPKSLVYLMPSSVRVITERGELVRFERLVDGRVVEVFKPDDNNLVHVWKLDHTTELLPSQNTDGRAMMNAAGIMFYADFWIKNFFERGGVKPTVIGISGNLTQEKQGLLEKAWSAFTRNISRQDGHVQNSKIINSDAVSVTPFGEGIDAMNKNEVYNQAVSNVAMALGIPLSLLLANSANYATAQTEYSSWFRDSITPRANFLARELTAQVFEPLGLRLEFRPENTDPAQEDEVARAQSVSTFADFMSKCGSYEVFIGICDTFGYELSETLTTNAKSYFDEKKKKEEELQKQLASGNQEQPVSDKPRPNFGKWVPSLDELEELRVWREVAQRKAKKGESLDFDYQPHYGGLPEDVTEQIKARLHFAGDAESIKNAFDLDVEADSDIRALAKAMNNLTGKLP